MNESMRERVEINEQTVIDRLADDWVPPVGLGERLLLLRKSLGFTVPQVAKVCGFSQATWSSWERGATPRDVMAIVQRVAEVTKCDVEWLMFGGAQNWKVMKEPLKSDMPLADRHSELVSVVSHWAAE